MATYLSPIATGFGDGFKLGKTRSFFEKFDSEQIVLAVEMNHFSRKGSIYSKSLLHVKV